MKSANTHILVRILSVIICLGVILSACTSAQPQPSTNSGSGSTDSEAKNAEVAAPAVEEAPAEEVTILYIDNPTWWSEQAARFSEETGIKVNWEGVPFDKFHDKMFTAFAAGDAPWDVIHVRDDWVSEFGSRGFLLPLEDRLTDEIKSKAPAQAWDNLSVDGHNYGVPRYFWMYQYYYNKDILADAGFSEPPKTWSEVAEFSESITADTNNDGKIDRWGYCETWGENFATNPFFFHLRAAGGEVFDEAGNPTFNSEAGVKALTWMANMASTDNFCPSAYEMMTTGVLAELFLQGSVGMIPCTPQMYSMANDPTKSKLDGGVIGAALMPGDVNRSGTVAETGGLAIPANAKNPDAAWKYIQFVTSYEEQKRMAMEPGNIPANIEALKDPEVRAKQPNFEIIEEQLQYPFGTIAHPRAQEINGSIARNVIQALHGNLTPQEALDKAYQEVVDIINQ